MTLACLIAILPAACLWMALAWVVAMRAGTAGLADVFWTFGTGALAAFLALVPLQHGEEAGPRQLLVAMLVGLWSLRLGLHILLRTWSGGEDPRYAKLKRDWGRQASRNMFWFLQVQAITMALLAVAVFVAARNPRPELDWSDWAGLLIVAAGIIGESISDQQLKSFAAMPGNRSRVCDVGLWSWSRHPNYFFEFVGWFAYPVIGIAGSTDYPWGWAALIGPALIFWIRVYASGIPPLEDYMLQSRGDAFRAYQRRVSAFVPRPPRKRPRDP